MNYPAFRKFYGQQIYGLRDPSHPFLGGLTVTYNRLTPHLPETQEIPSVQRRPPMTLFTKTYVIN